jgi:DNA-directed RNA polymerase specialized sigma24 family protein
VGGEQRVLEHARTGDPAAFDALFRSHASDVTRVCRRMLGSETAAQDATHEVFLRARRGFASDPGDLSDPGASPLSRALATERRAQVLQAIDALPLHYRLSLVLRYFHELDYEGIADVLNLRRSQVGTLLFRAKRRLRQELSGGSR